MEHGFERHWALPLRIVLGIAFLVHGIPKLSAAGQHEFQGMLGQLGVPAPPLMSWVVTLVEVLGGLALIVGLLTWIAALLLGIEMLVALFKVHLAAGFNFVHVVGMSPQGPVFGLPGWEVNLLYLAGLAALFIGGPGPISVDARAGAPEHRPLLAPWFRHAHARA
jgi:putative oxidoreductase